MADGHWGEQVPTRGVQGIFMILEFTGSYVEEVDVFVDVDSIIGSEV